jgi:hypothetical protein
MIPVSLVVDALDSCDPLPIAQIIQVTSNEPQKPVETDWEITGPLSLNLRADRLGSGRGRIYTIFVECQDGSGNVSATSVDVVVPNNKGDAHRRPDPVPKVKGRMQHALLSDLHQVGRAER